MAGRQVDYDDDERYVANRPRAAMVLHGPGGSHGTTAAFSALVDTGADYCQLPEEAARRIGLLPQQGTRVGLLTAGGRVSRWRLPVDVDIEGERVRVPVDFDRGAKPLLGRTGIFAALDGIGFTRVDWLAKWLPGRASPASTPTQASGTQGNRGIGAALQRAFDDRDWASLAMLLSEDVMVVAQQGTVYGRSVVLEFLSEASRGGAWISVEGIDGGLVNRIHVY
jgi:predicted aspartyl protease